MRHVNLGCGCCAAVMGRRYTWSRSHRREASICRFVDLSTIAGSARHLLLSCGSPCRPLLSRLLREERSVVEFWMARSYRVSCPWSESGGLGMQSTSRSCGWLLAGDCRCKPRPNGGRLSKCHLSCGRLMCHATIWATQSASA